MNKPETRLGTRIEVTKDGMRFRPRLVTKHQRKETETMNYREYNPDYSCLPAEAYPYLALALAEPQDKPATLWARTRRLLRRLAGFTPVLLAAIFLPLADPPPPGHYFRPGPDSQIHSLVWVQPLPGKRLPAPPTRPQPLPLTNENPYSL
jgi:hypothetical protein